MSITTAQVVDIVNSTEEHRDKLSFVDLTTDLTEYIALPQIFKQKRAKEISGETIEWRLLTDTPGAARHVGLYEEDTAPQKDGTIIASEKWAHTTVSWHIERRLVAMNQNPERILDYVNLKRHQAMIDLAQLMETTFWGKPVNSADINTPLGLFYWMPIPTNAQAAGTDADGAFNVLIPNGFTDVAGVSPTTYPNFNPWSYHFTDINEDDFLTKTKKAIRNTKFITPVPHPEQQFGGDDLQFYTNETNIEGLEKIATQQNDNLGRDVVSMMDRTLIKGNMVNYVPQLNLESANPFFAINWGKFKACTLRGEFFNESTANAAKQHTVAETHVDNSYQFIMYSRRNCFVGCNPNA